MVVETSWSVRRELRSATADTHAALDDAVSSSHPFESAERYRQFLERHRRARRRLRSEFGELGATVRWIGAADLDDALLDRDLRSLHDSGGTGPDDSGRTCTSAGVGAPGDGDRFVASTAARWGLTYVFEGSKLGGRVLSDAARERLGRDAPTRYLLGSDEQLADPARWRRFLEDLEAARLDTSSLAVAIAAAERAFAVFHEEFTTDPASERNDETETAR